MSKIIESNMENIAWRIVSKMSKRRKMSKICKIAYIRKLDVLFRNVESGSNVKYLVIKWESHFTSII